MISLCMITKNNAKTVAACIESVRPLVKEIIVTDTGSTDATKKIAASLGAKTFDFPWTNNFSEAKNAAYEKATQPWILNLDADEVIALRDLQKIKKLVEQTEVFGYFLIQRNYTNQRGSFCWTSCVNDVYDESKAASGFVPREMLRLFRNDSRIRAEGAIHDSVLLSIQRIGGTAEKTEIPIHHFGLLNRDSERTQWYIDIEKQNLRNDFFQEFQIGSQYHSIGKLNEAVDHLAKSLQLNPHFGPAYLELALIGMKRGKLSEVRPLLLESIRLDERENAWSALGIIEVYERDFEQAISCFQKAIALNPKNADHYFNLSQVLKEAGRNQEAREALEKAVYLNPAYKNSAR